MQQTLALCMILVTIIIYYAMTKVYKHYPYPFFIPAITTSALIILILVAFHIPYQHYMMGGQWISSLLGPSVAALAFPLYKQRHFLRQNIFPIIIGTLISTLSGMVSVGLLAKAVGMDHTLILSIIPKSLTIPVAIEVAESMNGNASMAIVGVIIGAILGVILAPSIFKRIRIHSSFGRGLALGSVSNAIGTSKAAEYNEKAFSMSSVSMALCAVIGAFLGPIVVWLIQI